MRKISRKIMTTVSFLLACSVCGMLTGCQTAQEETITTSEITETTPQTEPESETLPETEPESEPEPESEIIPETELETNPEMIPESEAEPEAETDSEIAAEENSIPTNAEFLQMLMTAFGMLSDGTFEGNLSEASAWDIVDADIVLAPDDAITADFLISAAMRATGLVTGSSSMEEITACAVKNGVIADQDLSVVDLSDADEIVEKAAYAWTHQEFSNEGGVVLYENVLDLSETIPESDVKINGDVITIPTEYAEKITEDAIVIFPGEQGGAYKIQEIGETDGTTVIIRAVPAEFEEVYQSIHVSY